MVKSCKGEILSQASLGEKKTSTTTDWLQQKHVILSELADTRKNSLGKAPVLDI